jgi:hypothetical protein
MRECYGMMIHWLLDRRRAEQRGFSAGKYLAPRHFAATQLI